MKNLNILSPEEIRHRNKDSIKPILTFDPSRCTCANGGNLGICAFCTNNVNAFSKCGTIIFNTLFEKCNHDSTFPFRVITPEHNGGFNLKQLLFLDANPFVHLSQSPRGINKLFDDLFHVIDLEIEGNISFFTFAEHKDFCLLEFRTHIAQCVKVAFLVNNQCFAGEDIDLEELELSNIFLNQNAINEIDKHTKRYQESSFMGINDTTNLLDCEYINDTMYSDNLLGKYLMDPPMFFKGKIISDDCELFSEVVEENRLWLTPENLGTKWCDHAFNIIKWMHYGADIRNADNKEEFIDQGQYNFIRENYLEFYKLVSLHIFRMAEEHDLSSRIPANKMKALLNNQFNVEIRLKSINLLILAVALKIQGCVANDTIQFNKIRLPIDCCFPTNSNTSGEFVIAHDDLILFQIQESFRDSQHPLYNIIK